MKMIVGAIVTSLVLVLMVTGLSTLFEAAGIFEDDPLFIREAVPASEADLAASNILEVVRARGLTVRKLELTPTSKGRIVVQCAAMAAGGEEFDKSSIAA